MRKNKVIGLLLLILAIVTIVGMVIDKDAYWRIENYVMIICLVLSGVVLLKQK